MKKLVLTISMLCMLLPLVGQANPVDVETRNPLDPVQDDWEIFGPYEELVVGIADTNELISSWLETWDGHIPCPVEYDGNPDDMYQVAISNQPSYKTSFFEFCLAT